MYLDEEKTSEQKRNDGLTFVLILTFIGSGLSAFSNGMMAASYDVIKSMIHTSPLFSTFSQKIEGFQEMFDFLMSGGKLFFFCSFLCNIGSLIGAYFMWKLNKKGFHIYTTSQLLLLIIPFLFIGKGAIGFGDFIFTGLFVFLYFNFFKKMEVKA